MEHKKYNESNIEKFKYGKLFINTARFVNSIHAIALSIKNSNGKWKFNDTKFYLVNNGKPSDHTDRFIPRPNNDTLYGWYFLDLKNGPVVIEIDESKYPKDVAKHFSTQITTTGHHTYVPLGTQINKVGGKLILVWEGYKGDYPTDGEVIKLESTVAVALIRVAVNINNESDRLKGVEFIESVKVDTNEGREIEEIFPFKFESSNFKVYEYFKEILKYISNEIILDPNTYGVDKLFIDTLKEYGIIFGKEEINIDSINLEELISELPKIFYQYYKDIDTGGVNFEWVQELLFVIKAVAGSKEFYKDKDSNLISTTAVIGPLATTADTALYQPEGFDSNNNELISSKNYKVTLNGEMFDKVAKAFWSITLYEKSNGFFFENDQWRYSTGSLLNLPKNEEGNYVIFVGPDKPEKMETKFNWLSTGEYGKNNSVAIDLNFRFYEPNYDVASEILTKNKAKYIRIEEIK